MRFLAAGVKYFSTYSWPSASPIWASSVRMARFQRGCICFTPRSTSL